jgi:uncharacterized protein YndB with AHSA1/START domain
MTKIREKMQETTTSQELEITRVFNAPRDIVWKAWTDPNRIRQWWGPRGYTAPECSMNFRVGGNIHLCMRSPEGRDFWSTGTYREIVVPERIVVTDSFADDKGNIVPASHYGFTDPLPLEMQIILTFTAQRGATLFNLQHVGMPPGMMQELAEQGWNESFDKLDSILG